MVNKLRLKIAKKALQYEEKIYKLSFLMSYKFGTKSKYYERDALRKKGVFFRPEYWQLNTGY